jgi:hypothetical protein
MGGVTVRGRGAVDQMAQLLEELSDVQISVGIHGEDAGEMHQGEITIGEIAAIHEFGIGVPQRSFLRSWSMANGEKNRRISSAVLQNVLTGMAKNGSADTAQIGQIGAVFVGDIQMRISAGEIIPPLSEETIAAKGSSTPLIDTGQLRSSIRYRYRTKNSGVLK